MSDALSLIEQVEKRLQLIEKRLERTAKERELSLKEKFSIHDRKEGLVRWFEAMMSDIPDEDVFFVKSGFTDMKKAPIKHLKEIVKNLSDLVDNALGVKFP